MPNLRISQLASLNLPFTGSEVVAIVRQPNTVTNKVTVANLAAYITASIPAMISASIGGGNQDLQSVITNGAYATSSNSGLVGNFLLGPLGNRLGHGDGNNESSITQYAGNTSIFADQQILITTERVVIDKAEATGSLLGTASFATSAATASYFDGIIASASNALTASYFFTSSVTSASIAQFATSAATASFFSGTVGSASLAQTASYALTASYVDVVGNNITVNYVGSQIQLTGSSGGGIVDTLQAVTTAGNQTSQSVIINATLTNGNNCSAIGPESHAEGRQSTSIGTGSHSEGFATTAIGGWSHSEGNQTRAIGFNSHTEGNGTTSIGLGSHSEGDSCLSLGFYSHAEGFQTTASGSRSHTEGQATKTFAIYSHAEGAFTTTKGYASHTEGLNTIASSSYSHAEGEQTVAIGQAAHAEGLGTIANASYQHAQGKYNIPVNGEGSFVIGNGISDISRSNLIYASGSQVQITGSLLVSGGTISGSFVGTVATASYVSGAVLNTPDQYATPFCGTIVTLTVAEYNAIVTKNANTLYVTV
jgi:hypothetical protein